MCAPSIRAAAFEDEPPARAGVQGRDNLGEGGPGGKRCEASCPECIDALERSAGEQGDRRDIAAVAASAAPLLSETVNSSTNQRRRREKWLILEMFFSKFGYRPILYSGHAEVRVSSGARVIINCMFAGRTG